MFLYQEWLLAIQEDIKQKYGTLNPVFEREGKVLEQSELARWMKKVLVNHLHWIRYSKVGDNQYDLKIFSPCPSKKLCTDMIESWIKPFEENGKGVENINFTLSYTNQKLVPIVGKTKYDLKEIRKELLFLFLHGQSRIIDYKEQTQEANETTYHLWVMQDSLPNMLKNGYLALEYAQ